MANRFILFLLFLAAAFLVLYILSVTSGEPDYQLLIACAACLGLGILVRLIFPARQPPPSNRFRVLKGKRIEDKGDNQDEGIGDNHRP